MKPVSIAVLASGAGTTADAFVRACAADPNNPCDTKLVICNKPGAGIFSKVTRLNDELGTHIQTMLINSHTHPAVTGEQLLRGRQTYAEQATILAALRDYSIDIVLLLGYMKHVGENLIEAYGWLPTQQSIYDARMINTHPGLLPLTQGLFGVHVQEKVLATHATEAGQTLHLVSAEYDDGPIIAEHRIPVVEGETADALFDRVQRIEKETIARDVASFVTAQQANR